MGIDVATYALPRLLTTRGTTVYHIIFIRNPILIKLGFTVAVKHTRVIPLLACGREAHHPSPEARFADAGKAPAATASAVTRMRHRLKTSEGKAIYAKRKSTVEPVFGVIKQVMGFRQFLLRGLGAVTGHWSVLATI